MKDSETNRILPNSQKEDRTAFWHEWVKGKTEDEIVGMIVKKESEAEHDSLTGIYNRRGWDNYLNVIVKESAREGRPVGVIIADIDKFKKVNDEWGHEVGDQALIFVAQILKDCTRESDVCARMGGDEFGILMPSSDTKDVGILRERIESKIKESFSEMVDDDVLAKIDLSISIGISKIDPGQNPEEAIKKADTNMYRVKRERKNV
jgi:diguanylate cyclase (GGDEF)-like protein